MALLDEVTADLPATNPLKLCGSYRDNIVHTARRSKTVQRSNRVPIALTATLHIVDGHMRSSSSSRTVQRSPLVYIVHHHTDRTVCSSYPGNIVHTVHRSRPDQCRNCGNIVLTATVQVQTVQRM
jgi:hypothetical protein